MAVIHTESGSDGLPSDDDASEPTPEDGNNKNNNLGWTTVSCKGQRTKSASREKQRHSKVLDDELNHVVHEAKRGLTPDDRVRINKRITALKDRPAGRQGDETSETTSRGEGPSALDKGKGIDPRNWGALSENGDDLDLDGQRAALESWNLACDIVRLSTADSEEGCSGSHLPKKNKHEQNNKRAREVSAREAKLVLSREAKCYDHVQLRDLSGYSGRICQVRVYSGRRSGQVRMKAEEGQGQGAGQGVSPAGVGDRLDSMTKDNER